MDNGYVLLVLLAMMGVTFALRALPFIASQWLKTQPFIARLKEFLPLCIMSLLVMHAGMDAARDHPQRLWATLSVLAAIALTIVLQWRVRQALLSILSGTLLFVLLDYLTR